MSIQCSAKYPHQRMLGQWGLGTGGVYRLWEGKCRKKGKQGGSHLSQGLGPDDGTEGQCHGSRAYSHSGLKPRFLQVN